MHLLQDSDIVGQDNGSYLLHLFVTHAVGVPLRLSKHSPAIPTRNDDTLFAWRQARKNWRGSQRAKPPTAH